MINGQSTFANRFKETEMKSQAKELYAFLGPLSTKDTAQKIRQLADSVEESEKLTLGHCHELLARTLGWQSKNHYHPKISKEKEELMNALSKYFHVAPTGDGLIITHSIANNYDGYYYFFAEETEEGFVIGHFTKNEDDETMYRLHPKYCNRDRTISLSNIGEAKDLINKNAELFVMDWYQAYNDGEEKYEFERFDSKGKHVATYNRKTGEFCMLEAQIDLSNPAERAHYERSMGKIGAWMGKHLDLMKPEFHGGPVTDLDLEKADKLFNEFFEYSYIVKTIG